MSKPVTVNDVLELEQHLFDNTREGVAFVSDNNDRPWLAGFGFHERAFAVSLPQEKKNGKVEHRSEFVLDGNFLDYPLTIVTDR